MSDRLKDLQRQRALAQEQLAWLEREIARETGASAPTPSAPVAPAAGEPLVRPVAQAVAPSAEEILAQFQSRGRPMHEEAKRGCLIYFFAAMTLLILSAGAYLLWKYK